MVKRYQIRQVTVSAVVVLELDDNAQAGRPSLVVDVSQAASLDDAAVHAAIQVALAPYMAAPLVKSAGPAMNTWIDAAAPAPVAWIDPTAPAPVDVG